MVIRQKGFTLKQLLFVLLVIFVVSKIDFEMVAEVLDYFFGDMEPIKKIKSGLATVVSGFNSFS